MAVTVTGTHPKVVTVAVSTTTADTTYSASVASGTDRRYAFMDDIVATVDATVNGAGLELVAIGPVPHAISLTNNAIVSSLTLSNQGLVELLNKSGPITYMGAGDVVSYGAASEAIKIIGGTGNVTFKQTGGVLYADDAETVEINSTGNV
ncbi:MAG TPA: hypothetical protein VHN20_05765, partial [Beijerinckiaceae bacterium]|nr:hypothetical protein [Beijerinckiaceae bacterium]